MPGPTTPEEAVSWALSALASGKYLTTKHFDDRCRERKFSIRDAHSIAANAKACEPYSERPRAGGTCWRIKGVATDGALAAIGIEAFRDHLGRRVVVITIMDG